MWYLYIFVLLRIVLLFSIEILINDMTVFFHFHRKKFVFFRTYNSTTGQMNFRQKVQTCTFHVWFIACERKARSRTLSGFFSIWDNSISIAGLTLQKYEVYAWWNDPEKYKFKMRNYFGFMQFKNIAKFEAIAHLPIMSFGAYHQAKKHFIISGIFLGIMTFRNIL